MTRSLSAYLLEAPTAGIPKGSGTHVFMEGLRLLLEGAPEGLEVRFRPLEGGAETGSQRPRGLPGRVRALARGLLGARREARRVLADKADILLFVYPKLPIQAHAGVGLFREAALQAHRALVERARERDQRLVYVIEDLPIEMACGLSGRAEAETGLDISRIRRTESLILRHAHRLIVPRGFVEILARHHQLPMDRVRTFRRNIYPSAPGPWEEERGGGGDPEARAEAPALPEGFISGPLNLFYSGSMSQWMAPTVQAVLEVLRGHPEVRWHLCGPNGELARRWIGEAGLDTATHYGLLPRPRHDALARECQIGLVLYSQGNPYASRTPTLKYSAYLAAGLAILSTDLREVSLNLGEDGAGEAVPATEIAPRLRAWLEDPGRWREYRTRARREGEIVRSGREMLPWLEELAKEGGG